MLSKGDRQRLALGLVFTGPWILGFVAFAAYPVCASFYYSLCDYNVFNVPQYIGMNNYIELFGEDPMFLRSLLNTLYFMVFAIPITMSWMMGQKMRIETDDVMRQNPILCLPIRMATAWETVRRRQIALPH